LTFRIDGVYENQYYGADIGLICYLDTVEKVYYIWSDSLLDEAKKDIVLYLNKNM